MEELFNNPTTFGKFIFSFLLSIFLFTSGIYYFLKYQKYQNTFVKTFIFFIIIAICANGIYRSIQYSDKRWRRDPGGEMIAINAAKSFKEKGFTPNYGLPATHYPKSNFIYTHTPPGAPWLIGIFFNICDSNKLKLGELGCPRVLSSILSSIALLFFAIMLYSSIGPFKSLFLMFFVVMLPLTRNMIYTLHYSNYPFSLFLIQLGFLLYLFKKKIKLNIIHYTIFFTLGFFQGWFSFHYYFHIFLSPLSFALLYSNLSIKEDKRQLVFTILLLFAGLCSAFLLHFIQNALYFGSFIEAYNDLFSIGIDRALGTEGWNIKRTDILMQYFFIYPRSWYFFIINLPIFTAFIFVLIWFKDIRLKIQNPINLNLTWTSSSRNYFVILSSFLPAFLWIFIMYHYSATEAPHLPRILFYPYLVCILTVLECISSNNSANQQC
jgi:hypothetical protein